MRDTPEIRFKGFTGAWVQRKLGEVAELSSSKRIHVSDYVSEGIPFYRGSEISAGGISQDNELYISEDLYSEIKEKYGIPAKGDLLITAVGTLGNLWKVDNRRFYYKDGNLIRISGLKLDEDYILAYFTDGQGKKKVLDSAAGSSQKALTMIKLNEIDLFTPELSEQTAIGNFFRTLDKTITLLKRKADGLKQLKKAYLQQMFPQAGERVPKVRFAGVTGDWDKQKLENYFVERSERSGGGELISVTINSGIVKASKLDRQIISSEDKSNYKIVKVGDIAYNSMRMWQGASGYSPYDGILSPAYTVITPNKSTCSPFFAYLFKRLDMIQIFQKKSQGLTSDTWNLKFPAFSQIEVQAPFFNEQLIIADFLGKLDCKIASHLKKIEQLQRLKSAYLQKMFL